MRQDEVTSPKNTPFSAFQETALRTAFDYVATFAPEVSSVSFDDDCRWCFMDAAGMSVVFPQFDQAGQVLDVAPLEAAADVVDFPATYYRQTTTHPLASS